MGDKEKEKLLVLKIKYNSNSACMLAECLNATGLFLNIKNSSKYMQKKVITTCIYMKNVEVEVN